MHIKICAILNLCSSHRISTWGGEFSACLFRFTWKQSSTSKFCYPTKINCNVKLPLRRCQLNYLKTRSLVCICKCVCVCPCVHMHTRKTMRPTLLEAVKRDHSQFNEIACGMMLCVWNWSAGCVNWIKWVCVCDKNVHVRTSPRACALAPSC